MHGRKILNITFGLLVAGFGTYGLLDALFLRLHNDLSCNDSTPASPAQRAALEDARSRAPAVCSASQARCMFAINDYSNADGHFRISPYVVESDFFEGCVYKDDSLDVFVYDQDGKFVRLEGVAAPYG